MRPVITAGLAGLLLCFCATPLNADDGACHQMDEVLSQLREIRTLIETRLTAAPPAEPQPRRAAVAVGDAPFIGSQEAPLTIVEFTDYQCPYCNRFYRDTFPYLKKIYIDPGKAKLYVLDLPLTEIHRNAMAAAEAAHCAREQGQFWAFYDRIQSNPEHLDTDSLLGYARELGMNVDSFEQCVESERYRSAIENSGRAAQANGAQGTPAFVVGKSTATGVSGDLIVGSVPFGIFEKALRKAEDQRPDSGSGHGAVVSESGTNNRR